MLKLYFADFLRTNEYLQQQIEHTQTLALTNVLDPEDKKANEYVIRHIFREYSKLFQTPLHIVQTLPLEQVFLHYYEHFYEDLVKEEKPAIQAFLLKERERLSETKEERIKRLEYEAENAFSDDDLLREAEEENKSNAVKQMRKLQQQAELMASTLENQFAPIKKPPEITNYNGPLDFKATTSKILPESKLPIMKGESIKQLPEGFKMDFTNI